MVVCKRVGRGGRGGSWCRSTVFHGHWANVHYESGDAEIAVKPLENEEVELGIYEFGNG